MADSEGADPTVGDDDIDLKGQLMPKLSQVDAVLKKEGGRPLISSGGSPRDRGRRARAPVVGPRIRLFARC